MPLNYTNMEQQAIEAAIELERAGLEAEKHELIVWLEKTRAARLAAEQSTGINYGHRAPLSAREPTYDDWHTAALKFVASNDVEDYNQMLSLVRLTHPLPNLWNEPETKLINRESEANGPFTLSGVWYACRIPLALSLVIVFFTLAIIAVTS